MLTRAIRIPALDRIGSNWRFPVTVSPGRPRLLAVLATLLTAALPAVAWAQSPSLTTASPVPTVAVTSAAPSAAPSTVPGASPAASPAASTTPAPQWTPPAVSGPVVLLTAGLDGDGRALSIEGAFRETLAESCPQATLEAHSADTAETQAQQLTAAIAAGASVLVLDAVDPTTAGALVTEAQTGGATLIALGDGITGAVPDLQVAYDDAATGSLVGAVVVQVAADAADLELGDDATPIPSSAPVEQVVLIDGPQGDARLEAWTASVKEGLGARATIVHEASVEELTAAEGERVMGEAIAALGNDGFGAVITPTDEVASGVISGLTAAGITPAERSVTGRGGTLPGTQAIVAGDQLLTTWAPEASAASVAAALACGQATGVGLPTGLTTTPVDNGTGEVPTVLLTGIVVTSDGSVEGTRGIADTIVADQAFGPDTVASICVEELTEACDDLGLVIPSPTPAPSVSPAADSSPAAVSSPAGASTVPASPAASGPAASPAT